jgi:hypothetical protein
VVIEMRKKDKLILYIQGLIGAVAEGPLAILAADYAFGPSQPTGF